MRVRLFEFGSERSKLLCFALVLLPCLAFAQGSLTPPGAPAPMMKTLSQIEPRAIITNLPVTLSQAGSYYLASNLTASTAADGILIVTNDVTVDLGGFVLNGNGVAFSGVSVPGSSSNIVVCNGTVRNWNGTAGIEALNAINGRFERLVSSGNAGRGIRAGAGALVLNCVASGNGHNGFSVNFNSVVADSTARLNGLTGINTDNGCTVRGCSVAGNLNGITTGAGCTVVDCTSQANLQDGIAAGNACMVDRCTSSQNASNGISSSLSSHISGCNASGNGRNGILVGDACTVTGNTAQFNGTGSALAGVHATGNLNRIDGNLTVANNSDGILVDTNGMKNFVIRNTSGGNAGFQIRVPGITGQPPAGANIVGPIMNDATNSLANAWSNFQQ